MLQRSAGNRAVSLTVSAEPRTEDLSVSDKVGPAEHLPVQRREMSWTPNQGMLYGMSGIPPAQTAPTDPWDWTQSDREKAERMIATGNVDQSNRFFQACLYNTRNNRPQEYQHVFERRAYYLVMSWWVQHDPQRSGEPAHIRFFDATAAVTGPLGVGGIEVPYAGLVVSDRTKQVMLEVNDLLLRVNMRVIARLDQSKGLTDPRQQLPTPTDAFSFDLRMVETEQGEVEGYLQSHNIRRGVNADTDALIDNINALVNTRVPRLGFRAEEINWAMEALGVDALDFTQQRHRMAIGRAMVYSAHGREKAAYLAFVRSGGSQYQTP